MQPKDVSRSTTSTKPGLSMPRRFPDLICIGAQKAATTWFDNLLRKDSAFYQPWIKELHYFTQIHKSGHEYTTAHRAAGAAKIRKIVRENPKHVRAVELIAAADLLERPEVDDDWYGSVFAQALPGQVCVDTSPSYLQLPEAGVRHLMGLNPAVKLLLFVRDPVDRAWSHIRMNLKKGIIPKEAVEFVLSGQRVKQYVENSEYRNSMTLWRKHSAPGQFNVVLYDEVAADPGSVMSRVYGIAGIAPPKASGAVDREVHKGQDMDFPKPLRARLLARLAPQFEFLAAEFPDAVAKWRAKHEAAMAC